MRTHQQAIALACLTGFAFSVNYTNHAPLSALLMQEFHFNKTDAGLLTSGIFLTHALMQIPGGHWADKAGSRMVMLTGLIIITLGNAAMAFAGSYGALLTGKICIGFGTGMSFISSARFLAQSLPAEKLTRAQGWYGASILLGSGFVLFAVPQIASLFHWSGAFLTTSAIAGIAALLVAFLVPSLPPKPHPPVQFSELLSHKELWLLGVMQMASFGLVIVIGSWINELLKQELGFSPKTAGATGSVVLLLGIFTRIYGGILVKRTGYAKMILLCTGLNLMGCALLVSASHLLPAVIIAIVALGIGCGLPYAALFGKASQLFPGRAGAAMGLVNMLGIIMILAGAPLLGWVADKTGNFHMAFVALALFSILAYFLNRGITDRRA